MAKLPVHLSLTVGLAVVGGWAIPSVPLHAAISPHGIQSHDTVTPTVHSRAQAWIDSVQHDDSLKQAKQERLRPPACLQDAALAADTALTRACAHAYEAYYAYQAVAYQHRTRVFAWQYTSSWLIFVVVVFLVFAGVYFSWIQFRAQYPGRPGTAPHAARQVSRSLETSASTDEVAAGGPPPAQPQAGAGATMAATDTTIKASATGIEISSPVLGVIILGLSLLFFYLYLKYVYPISETF